MGSITWDSIERRYRNEVIYPHRRAHNYPEHAKHCRECTPLVSMMFEWISRKYQPPHSKAETWCKEAGE